MYVYTKIGLFWYDFEKKTFTRVEMPKQAENAQQSKGYAQILNKPEKDDKFRDQTDRQAVVSLRFQLAQNCHEAIAE
jgi:hypothetical protein